MRDARAGLLPILTVSTILLCSPDCATLFRTRTQPISVTSAALASTVTVNRSPQGQTPIEIRLVRRKKGQIIRIESPGYNPFEIEVGRDSSAPNYIGDAIWGAAAGGLIALAQTSARGEQDFWADLAIDAPAGAAIRVLVDLIIGPGNASRSRELLVNLTKASQPPRVDTMSLEAKEFRDVKWIRIHRTPD
jgi:hypothetical protein